MENVNMKRVLLAGGIILVVGIGIVWKCLDGQKMDLKKLPTDELNDLRKKLHEAVLSPNSDQESKIDSNRIIEIIDNIIRARDPVDLKNYVFPLMVVICIASSAKFCFNLTCDFGIKAKGCFKIIRRE